MLSAPTGTVGSGAVITGIGVASDRHHDPSTLDRCVPASADPGWVRRELGRGFRYKDRATQLGVVAAVRAIQRSRAAPEPASAVIVSSNFGNLQTVCEVATTIRTGGVGDTSPMDLPNASSNVIAATIAIHLGLRGPNLTLCNGAPSGIDAVRWAHTLLRAGRAPRVLVVGVESATETAAALQDCASEALFDGAVALVVEQGGDNRRPSVGLHGFARAADEERAADAALRTNGTRPVRLRLARSSRPAAVDLERTLGRAGGALGVAQCAFAATRLAEMDGDGSALAVAGDDVEGAAAVLLTRWDSR